MFKRLYRLLTSIIVLLLAIPFTVTEKTWDWYGERIVR